MKCGRDSTVAMANTAGDTYEFTLPAFPNFSAVSFHLEAKDSNGLAVVCAHFLVGLISSFKMS